MRNKKGLTWKVGMFVTIGFILFVAAVYFIGKQKNLFGSTYTVRTVFTKVSGLQVGNKVRFSGINVGTVDNIHIINDTSVMVEMLIEKSVQKFIKQDSRATIGSEGLMGDKLVSISSGSSDKNYLKDYGLLESDAPVETEEILAGIQVTTQNAAIITDQLAEITYKINNGEGVISKLLMDSAIGQDLQAMMNNLKKSSAGLNENMEAAKHSFLLRGFFKKKEKAQQKKDEEEKKKKEEQKK